MTVECFEQRKSNRLVQTVVFPTDLLIALGRRAAEAAPGAKTFDVPEFETVTA